MKFSKLFLMSAAAVLSAAVACNKEETTDDTGNDDNTGGETTTIIVETTELEVSCDSNTLTVEYSVNNPVEGEVLNASVDVDWLSAVVGDEAITLTVDANSDQTSRRASLTLSYSYAQDVTVSVAQEAVPDPDYLAFIGTWTVTDANSTSATITISQDFANERYTISGWQFDGDYDDAYDLGFNETGSIDFTATYDSANNALVFSTYELSGEYTVTYSGTTLTGNIWLLGVIEYSGYETVVTTSSGYDLATMTITSEGNATITGGSVGTYDIIGAEYVYMISSPTVYSGYYLTWSSVGTYFPSTATKVSSSAASTSSVKSSERAVSVLSETNVVTAL